MTYQPPPPPPGMPPAGPGRAAGFDPKAFNPLDWGIVGAGALAFIFSLFDYYTASAGALSSSESAWHGFFGWFAALLAVAGAAVVAVALFAPQVSLPFPPRLVGLGAFVVATLFVIIALFDFPEDVPSGFGISTGRGFGFWASLIVIIAGTVLSLMRLQATGGQLPGGMNSRMPNIGGYGPQGGISGSSGAPRPAPGMPTDNPPPPPPPTA